MSSKGGSFLESIHLYRKVPKDLTDATRLGGVLSLFCAVVIAYLFVSNIAEYMTMTTTSDVALDDTGKVLVVGAKHGYAMLYHMVDGIEVAGAMEYGTAAEEFGDQVDISGNGHVIAVSAPQQDTGGAGYVKVYVREGAGCPEAPAKALIK